MKKILAGLWLVMAAFVLPMRAEMNQTKVLYVDPWGSDNMAVKGDARSPWQTLPSARAAANPGDTIIVFAGNYTNVPTADTNRINLLKNGVNWFFHDGANVYQASTNVYHAMFNDGHDFNGGTSLAVTSSISGKGSFYDLNKAGAEEGDQPNGVLELWNTNSIVHFEAKTIGDLSQSGFGLSPVYVRGCRYCSVKADDILGGPTGVNGVWWQQGEMDVDVQRIVTPVGWGVYSEQGYVAGTPNTSLYVRASLISGGAGGIWDYSNGSTNRVWVTAGEIKATGGAGEAILQQGAYLYVTAQKIGSVSTSVPTIHIDGGPNSTIGERTWITAQKVEGAYRYIKLEASGTDVTTNVLFIQHFDPVRELPPPTIGIETASFSVMRTFITGQNARIPGGTFVSHNSGTLVVQGYTIQAATAAVVAGSGLHLKGCTLVCSGVNSITAATPQSIGIYWSVANVTTNGNMTFSPNSGFTVDSNSQ